MVKPKHPRQDHNTPELHRALLGPRHGSYQQDKGKQQVSSTAPGALVWKQFPVFPMLEFLTIKCRQFYFLREFSAVLLTTSVYILPEAVVLDALDEPCAIVYKQESQYPEVISIISGDLNNCSLRKVLPKYHQHISCPTGVTGLSTTATPQLKEPTIPSYAHTLAIQTTCLCCCFLFTSRN